MESKKGKATTKFSLTTEMIGRKRVKRQDWKHKINEMRSMVWPEWKGQTKGRHAEHKHGRSKEMMH